WIAFLFFSFKFFCQKFQFPYFWNRLFFSFAKLLIKQYCLVIKIRSRHSMSIAKLYRVKDLVNYPARAGKVYVDRSGRTRTLSHREATIGLLMISASMVWNLTMRNDFPVSAYITANMPTWSENQIYHWLESKNRAELRLFYFPLSLSPVRLKYI